MKSCQILRSISEEDINEHTKMGDEVVKVMSNDDSNRAAKAKELGRQASKSVMCASKTVAKKSKSYTKGTINKIATALPNPEITILAVILVTIFIRAEEAHLKKFCNNDGSVGWIITAIGCCVVGFAKFYRYQKCYQLFWQRALFYFLIQVSLNYPPFGCLFGGLVTGSTDDSVYSHGTKTFAVIQVLILCIFAVVYMVVIYRKRIGSDEDEEREEV